MGGKKNLPICYICSSPLSGTLEIYNFAFLTGLRKIYSWFRRFFTMSPCLYSLPHASDQLIPSMWMNPFWFTHTRTFLRWLTFFPHLPPPLQTSTSSDSLAADQQCHLHISLSTYTPVWSHRSITRANKKGLRDGPWCIPNSTLKFSVPLAACLTTVFLEEFIHRDSNS